MLQRPAPGPIDRKPKQKSSSGNCFGAYRY
jgi:hypothetical protein